MRHRTNTTTRLAAGCIALLGAAALLAPGSSAAAGECPANEALREEQHTTYLPDCRAYELVSPADKGGADVMPNTTRIRASATETPSLPRAVMFPSLGGFAGAQGSGIAFDYLAQRDAAPGTQGWSTHAITPPVEPLPFPRLILGVGDPLYIGGADPDLTRAFFTTFSPLVPYPNTEGISNLYRRDDLRAPGPGSYQLASDATVPVIPLDTPTEQVLIHPAGATADLSHVVFETLYPLTADAPHAGEGYPLSTLSSKLYEWVNGDLRFVAQVPPAGQVTCTGAACHPTEDGSIAGQMSIVVSGNQRYTPHVLSDDGSRVSFVIPKAEGTNGPGGTEGAIYMRDDKGTGTTADDTTTQVNASDLTGEPGSQPARYWDASSDGLRVFFTTMEELTADATEAGVEKLYMWSAIPDAEGHHLTFISKDHNAEDKPGSVLGTLGRSDDGSVVYFVQEGQIVAGQPSLGSRPGIYVWRQGKGVSYVGRMFGKEAGEDAGVVQSDVLVFVHSNLEQLGARVSPDGSRLLASLAQPPWPGGPDHGYCPDFSGDFYTRAKSCAELYLYDVGSGPPVCVSCAPNGVPPKTDAYYSELSTGRGASASGDHLNQPLSPDGSRVYFTTGESLVPADTNGTNDAYEWEAPGSGSCTEGSEAFYATNGGCVYLLSSGTSDEPSFFLEATPDGKDVFIATYQQLVGWDRDGSRDVYDVRVDGGFPDPLPGSAPCSGESGCRGSSGAAPPAGTPASATLQAPGNPSGRRPGCRKGHVRRHGRCVKKPHHRKHRSHKHRRAGR